MKFGKKKKMEEGVLKQRKGGPAKYPGAKLSPDIRQCLARVGHGFYQRGTRVDDLLHVFKEAGYSLGQSTLYDYFNALDAGEPIFSVDKASGKHAFFSDQETEIFVGYILAENINQRPVHIWNVQDFIKREFGKEPDEKTTYKYLHRSGIGSRQARTAGCGIGISLEVQTEVASAWLRKHHNNGVLGRPLEDLYCADWVVSTVRQGRTTTLSPIGGPQPGVVPTDATYSDSILVVERADGDKRFRPMAFTRNPQADDPSEETLDLYKRYHVRPIDVVYVPGDGNYCAEHSLSTAHYFDQYDHFQGGTIITDCGNSWKMKDESVLEDRGFGEHLNFPACVHHHLSVPDNGINGPAKHAWRAGLHQLASDLERTLSLMQELHRPTPKYIRSCFERNWLLKKPDVPIAAVQALVCGEKEFVSDRISFHEKCRAAYLEWINLKKTRDSRSLMASGQGLDGSYWA